MFIRRLFGRWSFGRKSREHGVDRTPYKGDRIQDLLRELPHPGHLHEHREGHGTWTLHDAAQKAKGRLCGKRAGGPAALG